ncbi:MAG: hypothetical protein ACXADS_07590 [Candidatus Thorarchaeota archaeon]
MGKKRGWEFLLRGVPVPHCIHVRVKDSRDVWCIDVIAVTIEVGSITTVPPTPVVAAAGAGLLVIAAVLVLRRRGGLFVLLLLLMLVFAFTFQPIVSASSEIDDTQRFSPSAPTGDYDDGVKEVGIEWVGVSHHRPLGNTETNIEGFYNWMGNIGGYSREFNWGGVGWSFIPLIYGVGFELIFGIIVIVLALITLATSGVISFPYELEKNWIILLVLGFVTIIFGADVGGILEVLGAFLLLIDTQAK